MTEHTPTPWTWHAKSIDQAHNGSIYHLRMPGHAYAIAMQPRYVDDEKFNSDAAFIVKAVNNHSSLVKALTDLSNMYSHAWDCVDGNLVMLGPSIERFEKAHHAAQVALCAVTGAPLPISDEDIDDPVGSPAPLNADD